MMWALLIAAFSGVFGSMFGLGTPEQEARRGFIYQAEISAPTPKEEYQNSWFDPGFQANEESAGMPVNPTVYEVENDETPDAPAPESSMPSPLVDISLKDNGNKKEGYGNKESSEPATGLVNVLAEN